MPYFWLGTTKPQSSVYALIDVEEDGDQPIYRDYEAELQDAKDKASLRCTKNYT